VEKKPGYIYESLNIFDMLYLEQRLGNWGALYPAEQDIAIEELSPYNCRLLIETLLSSPRELRAAPDYPLFSKLMHKMWPEVMSLPINPAPKPNLIGTLRKKARAYIPSPLAQVFSSSIHEHSPEDLRISLHLSVILSCIPINVIIKL
jgi:hypothetical protein